MDEASLLRRALHRSAEAASTLAERTELLSEAVRAVQTGCFFYIAKELQDRLESVCDEYDHLLASKVFYDHECGYRLICVSCFKLVTLPGNVVPWSLERVQA